MRDELFSLRISRVDFLCASNDNKIWLKRKAGKINDWRMFVDNFCITQSLEEGGEFIGWFGVITSSILLPVCLFILQNVRSDKSFKFIKNQTNLLRLHFEKTYSKHEASKKAKEFSMIILTLVAICLFVYLVVSALLIRGTKKVRRDRKLNFQEHFE